MAQSNLFNGKQKDIILKLLTRKTLFNNQVPHIYGENLPAWFSSVHCTECLAKRNVEVIETGTHALKECPSVTQFYAAVSQVFKVPDSSNTLAGFFRRSSVGPRPTLIISNNSSSELTSLIVWLAAIQLISYRNSRTPFSNESMIYKLKSDFKTILSSLKGTTRGSLCTV